MRVETLLTACLVAVAANPGVVAARSDRPNLISIVTDDQADWTIGAYGNPEVRTPHLDRLARSGARFTRAFTATPVCSPSRVAFNTGLYGTQVGITDYLNREEEAAGIGLPSRAVTWAEVLQKSGYATELIGKWHLGTLPEFHPTRHGFDRFYGWLLTPQSIDPKLEVDGNLTQLKGSLPDLMIDEALRFAGEKRDGPFALSIQFLAPHGPYGPVLPVDSEPYANLDFKVPDFPGNDPDYVREQTRRYYASVHSVDRNVGRLLDGLDRLGLTEKTIVLFTSDHGYMIGQHGIQHKGNGITIAGGVRGPRRPNMFDHAVRVPLIIRWPGVVEPGTVIDNPVSNIDTFASILGMLGVPAPADPDRNGIDFSPVLRREAAQINDAIYGQYDLHNGGLAYMRMIRTDDWKLVRYYRSNMQDELFDLRNDPEELKNRHDDPATAEIRRELGERLEAWMKSIGDPLLRDPGYDASKKQTLPAEKTP
jgi:arylsulfatase A-like enzyme